MDPAADLTMVCVWRRRHGAPGEVLQLRDGAGWTFPSRADVADLPCTPIEARLGAFAVATAGWSPTQDHRWIPEDEAGPDAADALTQAGAAAIVWRRRDGVVEYLLLHRSNRGPAYEGDWAWSPPGGALDPGESHEACAARELREETGLALPVTRIEECPHRFNAFVAELVDDRPVVLSAEHDRCAWLRRDEAMARCLPSRVADTLAAAARQIGDAA